MPKAVGIDLGTTNSVVSVLEAGEPTVIPNAEGARTTPSVVGFSQVRRSARRRGRQASGHHQPRPHHPFGQAPHGHELDRRHRRQEVHAAGDQRPHPAEAEARRRGLPGRHRHPGRHHRAGVLRRRPAHRHQGSRPDRRPRSAAHHQRAHRGRACLRPRQGGRRGPHRSRVRPRRRHVRRVGARDRRRRLRSEVDPRRHPPRWRRLGPARHRLAGRRVQEHRRRRPRPSTRWPCSASRKPAEKAKIELSSVQETTINLPFITATSDGPKHLDFKLTRSKFQELTADLVDRCKTPFEQAIKDAGLTLGRDRPRRHGRWLHPHARRARAGAEA